MPNHNSCTFIGHLTRDPEIRYAQSGTAVCKSAIAVNDTRSKKDSTLFLDFVVFGKAAEVFERYCHKGDPVFVSGRLQLQRWDAKDGTKRSKHELLVDQFQFLGGKSKEAEPASRSADDHIPF